MKRDKLQRVIVLHRRGDFRQIAADSEVDTSISEFRGTYSASYKESSKDCAPLTRTVAAPRKRDQAGFVRFGLKPHGRVARVENDSSVVQMPDGRRFRGQPSLAPFAAAGRRAARIRPR